MEETKITIHGSTLSRGGFWPLRSSDCAAPFGSETHVWFAPFHVTTQEGGRFGCQGLDLAKLATMTVFDLIFNTVPALVFSWPYLRLVRNRGRGDWRIASSPGGTDFRQLDS